MMKWIKILITHVCLIILLWGCGLTPKFLQTTPTPTAVPCLNCVSLEATINKQNFVLNEPITMTITLRKLTTEPRIQYYNNITPMQTFNITVFDQTGTEVSLTQTGMETFASGGRVLQTLTPNYPLFLETFNIANWYRWSQTGVYTVTVEKTVSGDHVPIPLTSQPLTFTLVTN